MKNGSSGISGEGRSPQEEGPAIAKVGGNRDTRRARSEFRGSSGVGWKDRESSFNHLPRNSRKNLRIKGWEKRVGNRFLKEGGNCFPKERVGGGREGLATEAARFPDDAGHACRHSGTAGPGPLCHDRLRFRGIRDRTV